MSVIVEVVEGVMSITLDRPEAMNAITEELAFDLAQAFATAAQSTSVRVVLLRGHRDFFCAGADLKEVAARPPRGRDAAPLSLFHAMLDCSKPIITMVSGVAVGAGATIPFLSDIIYAADNATFSFPFTQLGLCPEAGASASLSASIGHHRAAEILLFGAPLTADEALRAGLINRVVPLAESFQFARDRAALLAQQSFASLKATKALMRGYGRQALARQIDAEFSSLEVLFVGPDAREAFSALGERRKPVFR